MRRDRMDRDYEDRNELRELLNRWERSIKGGRKEFFDTDDYLRLSDYYLDQQKLTEAQNVLMTGLRFAPTNIELLLQRSRLLLCKGKQREALDLLRKVEANTTTWDEDLRVEALMLKGGILISMNKVWEAEQVFVKQLNVNRMVFRNEDELLYKIDMIQNIAQAYQDSDMRSRALGYYDLALDALKRYQAWVSNSQDLIDARWDLLIQKLYILIESYDEESFTAACRLGDLMLDENPYDEELWFMMAQSYMTHKRFTDALNAYENLLAINPSNDFFTLQMARAHYNLGEYQKAIDCINRLIEWNEIKSGHYTEGDTIFFYQMRGECEDLLQQYEKALESYQRAIKEWERKNTDNELSETKTMSFETYEKNRLVLLLIKCGHSELKQENHDAALSYFRRAVQEAPTDTYAMLCLADEELRIGGEAVANKLYHSVLEYEPDNIIALVGSARVEINLGHYKKAMSLLIQARNLFEEMTHHENTEDYDIFLLTAVTHFCLYQSSGNRKENHLLDALDCLRIAIKYKEDAVDVFFSICPSAMTVFSK